MNLIRKFNLYNSANIIFTGVYIVEMLIKMIALNPFRYIIEKGNLFDCLICIISIIDVGKLMLISYVIWSRR